jgi:hypothetical protein
MTIRVVQQLSPKRFEVMMDDTVRDYLDLDAIEMHASLGEQITWDVPRPRMMARGTMHPFAALGDDRESAK